MIEKCIVGNFDIFMAGLVIGGALVIGARALQAWANIKISNNRKRLDIELDRAILRMEQERGNHE